MSADLSVHQVPGRRLWFHEKEIKLSCRAIIEIKCFICESKRPKTMRDGIITDLKKLSGNNVLRSDIIKFMLIVDENNQADANFIQKVRFDAKKGSINILSNNTKF